MAILRRWAVPAAFLLAALAVFAAVLLNTLYTTAYAVNVDGENWGYVQNEEDAEQAVADTEEQVSEILNEDYSISLDVETEKVFINKGELTEPEEIQSRLYDSIPEITEAYVLTVDGEQVGIGDEDSLNKIVENVVNEYVNENTKSTEIISDVEINYKAVASDLDAEPEAIADSLNAVTEEAVVYTAREGDTVEAVLEETDLSAQELASLNPELEDIIAEASDPESGTELPQEDPETEMPDTASDAETETADTDAEETETADTPLEEGTDIVIAPEQKMLIVETLDDVPHEEIIDYEYEVVEDDTMYEGETKMVQKGETGTMLQYESITYQNGVETNRWDAQQIITCMPVNEVTAVGTKELNEPDFSNKTDDADGDAGNSGEQPSETVQTTTVTETTQPADTGTQQAVSNSTGQQTGSGAAASAASSAANTSSGTSAQETAQTAQASEQTQDDTYTYTSSSGADELRAQIVAYAKQFCGCAYVHGGHGPNVFDCSGLTGYVYAHFGYSLPWTVEGQYACGTYVPLDVNQMLPGDLIFWSYGGSTPTHVGMYIGNGQYIQATKPGDVVRINTVSSYSGQPLVGCRRIIN